jgi:hypothetical protein
MSHRIFIRHTYIYKCGDKKCNGEWKINEAMDLERLSCPHCGKNDTVEYVLKDQRDRFTRRFDNI